MIADEIADEIADVPRHVPPIKSDPHAFESCRASADIII